MGNLLLPKSPKPKPAVPRPRQPPRYPGSSAPFRVSTPTTSLQLSSLGAPAPTPPPRSTLYVDLTDPDNWQLATARRALAPLAQPAQASHTEIKYFVIPESTTYRY